MSTDQKPKIAKIIRESNGPLTRKQIAGFLGISQSGIPNNLRSLCKEGFVIEHKGRPYTYSWTGKDEGGTEIKQETATPDKEKKEKEKKGKKKKEKKKKKTMLTGSLRDYLQLRNSIYTDAMNFPIPIKVEAWGNHGNIDFPSLPKDVQELIKDTLLSIPKVNGKPCLNRKDVFNETDIDKKFIKVLMWGYPDGKIYKGNTAYMPSILKNKRVIIPIITALKDKNFTADDFIGKTKELSKIKGIGTSTFSKLMYFFKVSINGKQCLIFDSKAQKALERYTETEHLKGLDQQIFNNYPTFVEGIWKISDKIGLEAESIEFILFFVSDNDNKYQEFNSKYKKP